MNFAIPRKNLSEYILYIWKIIDLPNISYNELLYKISFELFLESPQKALELINNSIENQILIKDDGNNLSLSQNLKQELIKWQTKRTDELTIKLEESKRIYLLREEKEDESSFNVLFRAFLDKGTLNRAAIIPSTNFDIIKFDFEKGFIKASVTGKQKESYSFDINIKNKTIIHNCQDFQERRSKNKKFCKHLARLFLILKEKNEKMLLNFLHEIAENINQWEFSG